MNGRPRATCPEPDCTHVLARAELACWWHWSSLQRKTQRKAFVAVTDYQRNPDDIDKARALLEAFELVRQELAS